MDFLKQRSIETIRRELKDILDSYHQPWDLLSELLQNAVDAIRRRRTGGWDGTGFVLLDINADERSIAVMDNGVGISQANIKHYLAPGGGDKDEYAEEVGEKGVGLTFCLFSCNQFTITSKTNSEDVYSGQVEYANRWMKGDSEVTTDYNEIDVAKQYLEDSYTIDGDSYDIGSFTRVCLKNIILQDDDIFKRTEAQLVYELRTKTALGSTHCLWNDRPFDMISVYYLYDKEDRTIDTEVKKLIPEYYILHKLTRKSKSLEEVRSKFAITPDERTKRNYLKDVAIYDIRKDIWNGKKLNIYGVMYPGHVIFKKINVDSLNLMDSGQYDESSVSTIFKPSIMLATKGIPTGVELDRPSKGGKVHYYQRCCFILEYDGLRFDLGRKSIHWKPKRKLQEEVASMFKDMEKFAKYQSDEKGVTESEEPYETKAQREARIKENWRKYRNLVELNFEGICYKKIPNNQEAAVAAIFHEMLGAKILKKYHPIASGYGNRYDLHALYNNNGSVLELIIEFKYTLDGIIKDLQNNIKYYQDIDMLVGWTADKQKMKDHGLELDELSEGDAFYEGVTHKICAEEGFSDPMPVILIEELIRTKKIDGE